MFAPFDSDTLTELPLDTLTFAGVATKFIGVQLIATIVNGYALVTLLPLAVAVKITLYDPA